MNPNDYDYVIVRDGGAIRDARERTGMTLRELADACGLRSHTYLVALEKGRRHTCSPQLAWAMSLAFGLTLSEAQRIFDFQNDTIAA